MGQKLDPLTNSHISYRTMNNIINPYVFNSDVRAGVIADWPMNEGAGSLVYDKFVTKNGTIIGAAWAGNRLNFDGGNNKLVQFSNADTELNPTTELTISVWVYQSGYAVLGAGVNPVFTNSAGGGQYNFYIFLPADKSITAGAWTSVTTQLVASNVMVLNTWTHIVVTAVSASALKIYKNGVLIATGVAGSTVFGNNPVIGSMRTNNFLGQIGWIRPYNRALTQAEVTQLYNFQKGQYL